VTAEELRAQLSLKNLLAGDFSYGETEKGSGNSEEEKVEYKYNNIYHILKIPMRIEKFLFYCLLMHVQAILYTLLVLPVRAFRNLFRISGLSRR
jgi:hypothetical protein